MLANAVTAAELDSLTSAILEKSMSKLRQAAQASASFTVRFLNASSDITALHVALAWFPEAFPALIATLPDPSTLQADDTAPGDLMESLTLAAIRLTERACIGKWKIGHQCPNCKCNNTQVHVLLNADFPVHWSPMVGWLVSESPNMIREEFVAHLVNRRQRLCNFAIDVLPRKESIRLGLHHNKVLDTSAAIVIESIKRHGHSIPTALTVGAFDDPRSESVYRNIVDFSIAEQLFGAGFRPVNVVEGLHNKGFITQSSTPSSQRWWHYMVWLLEKDTEDSLAKEFSPLPCPQPKCTLCVHSFSGHTLAHRLASACTWEEQSKMFWTRASATKLASRLFSSDDHDDCVCGCANSGCSPLTILMNALVAECDDSIYLEPASSEPSLLRNSASWPESVPRSSTVVSQFLRSWTFNWLDCQHTCCRKVLRADLKFPLPRYFVPQHISIPDDDYREEMRQDDRDKLALLEDLVEEFETAYSHHECSLGKFLLEYCEPRMDRAIRQLEAKVLTDGELLAIREI